MDIELNTPFKNDIYFYRNKNNNNIYPQRITQRNISMNKADIDNNINNNTYNINKLKNDLSSDRNNIYSQNPVLQNNNIYYNNKFNQNIYLGKNNYILTQINYFLEMLKPFSTNIIMFRKLSIDIPLFIYFASIIFKKFFSKKLTNIYLLLLIFLPCCCHIILNKAIIEFYFNLHLFGHKKISIKNFWKIFLCGFTPFIFGHLLICIFKTFSDIKIIFDIFGLIYGSHIAKKILVEFIVLTSIFNNKNDLKKIIDERDDKKIFFIFIAFYFLLSYIINL